MYGRFQELMTQGYALANKLHFKQFNPHEFEAWIDRCERVLSNCEPEPCFPCFPDACHIEGIVMLLSETSSRISRGQVQYTGVL